MAGAPRQQQGRGAGLLHPVLAGAGLGAGAGDCRLLLWPAGRARRALPAAARPARQPGRGSDPAGTGRRAQPGTGTPGHAAGRRPFTVWRHQRICRAEVQPGRHLASAAAHARQCLGRGAHAPAIVRHGLGAGVFADGVAGGQRSAGAAGKIPEPHLARRLAGAGRAERCARLHRHRRHVRRDLQDAAARPAVLA